MIIFSFPHGYNGVEIGALDFVADIGCLLVGHEKVELKVPQSGNHLVAGGGCESFSVVMLPDKSFLASYNGREFGLQSEYSPAACENYLVAIEEDESSNKEIVVIDPSGEELYRVPFQYHMHLGDHHLALGSDTEWRVFDMDGREVFSIYRPSDNRNLGEARFSKPLFFFPLSRGEEYEIYDVERERATGVRRFSGAILAVLDLPDGSVLVADSAGIHRFRVVAGEVEASLVSAFESALDKETRVLAWTDGRYAYMALDIYEAQSLLLLPLNGEPTQRLNFPNEWRIDVGDHGFKEGFNILPLARRFHTFDRAQLIWTPEETLSQDSFHLDISENIEIEQAVSAVKGKHSYCIRVKDKSVNKAIRSAASELSRLIHETCNHPLGWEGNILDKKFDGQFRVEIYSANRPNEFEQSYLTKFVAEFREIFYFKPAKSKASLAIEVVWGNLEET